MQIARELSGRPGVVDAAVVMATPANKSLLADAGLLVPEIEAARPDDLLVVVRAETDAAAEQALEAAGQRLAQRAVAGRGGPAFRSRTIRGAASGIPQASLALISVAGPYAAAEAWESLRSGLHVMLFSDNVPLEDEIALKRYALEHELLMMGPGCGSAIVDGAALGFANVVPTGPVGIVAASGTGLQETSTLLAKEGIGLSQAIGTGGRDLHEAVGGMMMRASIGRLRADARTEVLLLVSKPPAPAVVEQVVGEIEPWERPVVVCFLGGDPAAVEAGGGTPARTLQEAAYLAAALVRGEDPSTVAQRIARERADLGDQAQELRRRLKPGQRFLRGLFSGGSLANEALVVWQETVGDVRSNVPLALSLALPDPTQSQGHCAIDLGEAAFTVGRPHPMIDHDLRVRRLMQEAADPEVAVVVLDVVLGYGAHPDPAGELARAIYRARRLAAGGGRDLLVVASVTGTAGDPQGLERQTRTLERAGAIVASCNAAAARLAGMIVMGKE